MVAVKRQDIELTPEQIENARKFTAVYAAVSDKEKARAIAIVNAFMDGMEAQRLMSEEKGA